MVFLKIFNTGFPAWRIGIFLFTIICLYSKPILSSTIILPFKTNDSINTFIETSEKNYEVLQKALKKTNTIETFNNVIDSLGFFNIQKYQSGDSIIFNLNNRAIVDTIIINSQNSLLKFSNIFEGISFPLHYNSRIIKEISENLINICANSGYPFASITISMKEENDTITPSLKLTTEKNYCFESPILKGNCKISNKTLKNDLLIKKGIPFNLNNIEETILRLNQRPYIKSAVANEPVIIPEPMEIQGKKDTLDNCQNSVTVPLEIEENSGMGIDGILGFSSAEKGSGLNGQVNMILQNVLHRGEALTLDYRGEEDLQEFSLTLDKAYPFGVPLIFSGFFDLEILSGNYGSLKGGVDLLTSLKRNLQVGFGVIGHEPTMEDGSSWYSVNFDLLLKVLNKTYGAGVDKGTFSLRTGSGYRDQKGEKLGQFSFKFKAQGQLPFFRKHAFYGSLFSGLITTAEENLHETEMIRIGGHTSLRGYAVDEYSFTACAFLQFEYRFYFINKGSIFLFADGGAGALNKINVENSTSLFGYGLGIRVPVRAGRLSLEYARNYKEGRSPGRIHIRIQNSLSKGM